MRILQKFNFFIYTTFFILYLLLSISNLIAQQKIKIAIWGDSRENLDNACENIAGILLNDITDWDFQIHTGDFTHDGSEKSWKKSLNYNGINKLFVKGKMFLSTSNHEFEDAYSKDNWVKYTAGILPQNSADNTTHFYAYHIANVHVIFCDAYVTDKTEMQKWLDNYLNKVKDDEWLIGVWHNPSYDNLSYKESYLETCLPWLKSLYKHKCKFVINGHAHVYIRSKPLNPEGDIDNINGIVHIVNGTGGASFKDPVDKSSIIDFSPSVKSFPVITFLTINGNKAHLETVDARDKSKLQLIDKMDYEK